MFKFINAEKEKIEFYQLMTSLKSFKNTNFQILDAAVC